MKINTNSLYELPEVRAIQRLAQLGLPDEH